MTHRLQPGTESTPNARDIYDPGFVQRLFDEMSPTYGLTNYLSSFGFTERWRRQCVEGLAIRPGMVIVDLMSGMGETWEFLVPPLSGKGHVIAVDISRVMCRKAQGKARRRGVPAVVIRGNALSGQVVPSSMDCVVSAFGLKTFSPAQLRQLAARVSEMLKPGGVFSFIEISVPPSQWIRLPFMFYLKRVIPWVGRLCLGNPDNYRLLGEYTERFGSCELAAKCFEDVGLTVELRPFFFGCATRISGRKLA